MLQVQNVAEYDVPLCEGFFNMLLKKLNNNDGLGEVTNNAYEKKLNKKYFLVNRNFML